MQSFEKLLRANGKSEKRGCKLPNISGRTKSGDELIIDHLKNYSGAILECVEIGSRKFPGIDIGLLTIIIIIIIIIIIVIIIMIIIILIMKFRLYDFNTSASWNS